MSDLTDELRAAYAEAVYERPFDPYVLHEAADRIEELEAQDAAFVRTAEMLTNLGPADIGMVQVRMDRPATGENATLWREADDE